jgi:hypothetical protein
MSLTLSQPSTASPSTIPVTGEIPSEPQVESESEGAIIPLKNMGGWFRFSASLSIDPRIIKLGEDVCFTYVALMSHSWRDKSGDGEVPTPHDFARFYPFPCPKRNTMFDRYMALIKAGFMVRTEDGRYLLTEFVQWQLAKDFGAAERKRRQRARDKSKSGK